MSGLQIGVILTMIILNAVFAAFELALASVGVHRLEQITEQRRSGARAALRMKNRMEASLAVVQLGITFVGAIAAAVGGAGADDAFSPWVERNFGLSAAWSDALAITLVVLPLAAVTIIIGELVPKSFAIKHAEWVALKLSPLMQVFSLAAFPAVVVFEWITKRIVGVVERLSHSARNSGGTTAPQDAGMNELLINARALRMKRVISPEQERVIVGAGRLADLSVLDIMIPAEDIKMLYADGRLTDHLVAVHLEAHTRFLVTEREGDSQGIVGYVNVKDLFFLAKTHPHNPSLREILRPLLRVDSRLRVNEALSRMMRDHLHLALVHDGTGRVLGMITLEDVLEEVVGDIQDEYDRLPRALTRAGRSWVAGGGVTLGRLREALNMPELGEEAAPSTSLHEWLNGHNDSPTPGMAFELGGVRILIRKVRRDKVMEAILQPIEQTSATPEPVAQAR